MQRKVTYFLIILFAFIILPANKTSAQEASQHFDRGVVQFDKGEYEKALESFKMATEEKGDFVEAYFNIGVINDLQGDYKEAIAAYKKVIEIDSTAIDEVYENLAIDSYRTGNLKDTLIYAKMAESKGGPLSNEIKSILANYTGEELKTILNPLAIFDSGQLDDMRKELNTEIAMLERQIEKKEKPSAKELLALAVKYRQAKNIDNALKILNRAITEYGETQGLLAEMSLCYFLKGNISLFVENFKKARTKGYKPSVSLSDLYSQSLIKK